MNDVGGYLEAIAAILTILAFFGVTNFKEFKNNGKLPISRNQRRLLTVLIAAVLFWWAIMHPLPQWLRGLPGVKQAGIPIKQTEEIQQRREPEKIRQEGITDSRKEAQKALKEAEEAWQELE